MIIWGINTADAVRIVDRVSKAYSGNICFKRPPEKQGKGISFTLGVESSRCPGARRSASGRRVAAACWHAYRDVISSIFEHNEKARVKSAQADYHGKDNFLLKFEQTGRTNIGSMFEPCCYKDACDC